MNGARARILRGVGYGDEQGAIELVMKSEARNLRVILTDTQHPAFAARTAGPRPFAPGESDPIAKDRREFIRQVIALLESHRRAGDFEKLVVFAAQDMLNHLHKLAPQSLHDVVQCEVPKNLLHLPEKELCTVIMRELEADRPWS